MRRPRGEMVYAVDLKSIASACGFDSRRGHFFPGTARNGGFLVISRNFARLESMDGVNARTGFDVWNFRSGPPLATVGLRIPECGLARRRHGRGPHSPENSTRYVLGGGISDSRALAGCAAECVARRRWSHERPYGKASLRICGSGAASRRGTPDSEVCVGVSGVGHGDVRMRRERLSGVRGRHRP